MSTLASLWADLAAQAMELDPDAIRTSIRTTVDDGLRAARYDGAGGRSADTSSHPERQALNTRRDPSWADLAAVDHHEARFVTAVAELAIRSHSHGAPETWAEAVKDAHLLAEMDAIGVLERIPGEKPARWVHQAGDALHDLELIARRHLTRIPTDFDRNHESVNDATCRNHLRIGASEKRATKMLCDWCYRHVGDLELAGLGPAVDLQHDPAMWPSEGMLRAEGRVALGRERRDWLVSHGLRPLEVDRLRSSKRASG